MVDHYANRVLKSESPSTDIFVVIRADPASVTAHRLPGEGRPSARKGTQLFTRIRKAIDERDEGFTLIELLVVIIIIGILAAIAIPVFLNQRKKGYDAQAKSDLRNIATAEETYFTDNQQYAGTVVNGADASAADTIYYRKSSNAGTPTVVFVNAAGTAATPSVKTDGFCVSTTADSGVTWVYNSSKGGLQAKGQTCPA